MLRNSPSWKGLGKLGPRVFMKNSLTTPLEHSISNITSFPFFLYLEMGKKVGGNVEIMSQISKSISWTSARPWILSKLIDHQILTLYICITLEIVKLFGIFFCYLKQRLCGHNALRGPVPFQKLFWIHKKKQDYLLCLCIAIPLQRAQRTLYRLVSLDKGKWRQTSIFAADSAGELGFSARPFGVFQLLH